MRLLDRYLLRELVTPLGYCLGGFLIFWISFDLISSLDEFQSEKLKPYEIAQYYAVKLPELLVVVLPVALLLALLYALTNHARHHELTAMRAAGLSLLRLCVPYFGVGLFLSVTLYLLSEHWVPNSADLGEQIRKRHTDKQTNTVDRQWIRGLTFQNDRDVRLWRIQAYNVETGEMREPYVQWTRSDGSRQELIAERGLRTNGVWTFYNVRQSTPASSPDALVLWQHTNELAVAEFSETPERIKSEIKISKLDVESFRSVRKAQLSIREILEYKRLHPGGTGKNAMLDTKLHGRLAAPWTCLVVVLIAIPFGAPSGRRNLFVGVASSILICFAYFVLQQLSLALGTRGMPPVLAAWLPNVVVGSAGFLFALRVR